MEKATLPIFRKNRVAGDEDTTQLHSTGAVEETLDPQNWDELRSLSHRMLDDMIDSMAGIRDSKVWQPIPADTKQALDQPLPTQSQPPSSIYKEFADHIKPYPLGNAHPRFWGWVCGTGTATGMLADMLASGMNASPSFGEHASLYVEKQVLNWTKEMYGFPQSSSGILTTGASLANVLALATARNHFGKNIRKQGLQWLEGQPVAYTSAETHNCVQKAMELLGIGSDHLRRIPVDDDYKIRIDLLEERIAADRSIGYLPFCIIGNAGTVNTGSIDDLEALATIAKREGLWFHVDGAFGAVPNLLPEYKTALQGLDRADSIAFDYHKWFYVNYDVGGVLIRDAAAHKDAFAFQASYLVQHERGIPAGNENFSHLGIELSRGFRALKVWMMLKEAGTEKYQRLIRQNIQQAQYLAGLITGETQLELLAPVPMNIVCFRFITDGYNNEELNKVNKEILMRLHESGVAAPSFTTLNGCYAIRVAITNHRSRREDFDLLVNEIIATGQKIINGR
jgi:aromatic-L-amino-acid decarboxylase